MKIVFFGTPDYVLPILNAIHKKFVSGPGKSPITAVVTQKPKPTGRKKILTYSAVDRWAHEHKIPVFYGSRELLKKGVEADTGLLESYGEILPKEIINLFPHGILNAHPSLLPKWRGASPVQAAILAGDKQTGVTIIKLDEDVDHGEVISQFREEILPLDTTDTLRKRLFQRAASVLVELIEPYLAGKISARKQDDSLATFTTRITKEDGFIPATYLKKAINGEVGKDKWTIAFAKDYSTTYSSDTLERFIRAMQSWPQAWTQVDGKRLKLLKAHLKDGKLVLDEVQLEGKNPVSWQEFRRGYPNATLV